MVKIFILILFLIYFWYFYLSYSKPVPKPSQGNANGPQSYSVEFTSPTKNSFQFTVNKRIVWEETIPESHTFANKRLVEQDACHSIPDGQKLVASGETLYTYLNDNLLSVQSSKFKVDATTILQKGNVFYFTCQGGRIHKLDKCPSGELFYNGKCEHIEECTGKKDNTLLPVKDFIFLYYRCKGGKNIVENCPKGEFFLINNCHSQNDLTHYCRFFNESFLLDPKTRVDCINNLPVYVTCEPGLQFFDLETCESTACVGKANGTRIPNDSREVDGLSFHAGYLECQNDRIHETVTCPEKWDPYLSNGDNLTHLPMVFDGQKCSVPEFCTNVEATDSNYLVPVHEFSKYIGNWVHADFYDSLACYRCRGKKRERIDLPPGQQIKHFKRESACQNRVFTPILGKPKEYYDCNMNQVQTCEGDKEFDGVQCKSPLPHPFKFNNMSMFQFDSLTQDNWIVPWTYGRNPSVEPCPASNSIYLKTYNICSHPDCEKYAFLSHIPSMQITDIDGSICSFEKQGRLLTKTLSEKNKLFDYWTQRKVSEDLSICVAGQNLKTGNFVWDKTLFATCDENQPFIFCPSSATLSITNVEGKAFACEMPIELNRVYFVGTAHFEKHELKHITPTQPNQTIEIPKNNPFTISQAGMDIDDAVELHVTEPVILDYQYRCTHPPNVAYSNGIPIVSSKDGAFLIKRKDFTMLTVKIPEYNVQSFMSDFK